MAMNYMTPFRWGRREAPVRQRLEGYPVDFFRSEMNQLLDDFFKGFGLRPFSEEMESFKAFNPRVDMTEDDSSVQIKAELPGMDEKDIEISLDKDSLTIKGEKKTESENKEKESSYMERSYGSFTRVLPISADVNTEKAEAVFKKGVLTISLPKLIKEKKAHKKITITGA